MREQRPAEVKRALKVLVVDDDADIAEAIADVLMAVGHAVEIAADGEAALRIAHAGIELVLLDWRLPGAITGAPLVAGLRAAMGRRVPVIVLSADPNSRGEARAAQADDYLPKPFDVKELVKLVRAYAS